MKYFKSVAVVLGLILSVNAFAGFGGSRGGGSFSSGRSSFGGSSSFSRSYSAPSRSFGSSFGGFRSAPSAATVTMSRPSYSAPVSTGTVRSAPVINHYSSGSSNDGLLTGMMVGSMMSRNNGTTVVQSAPPVVYADPSGQQPYVQQPTTVVANNADSGWGFLKFILIVGILGSIAYGIYVLFFKRDENGSPLKW